ncbi:electron transfer flavoprotein beta subunit [Candida albicans P57072]|nr:electron transfer flavoprotein beta subunit [Candida albicans P94015]KGQ99776.1 electron transfer flavoprotein beta subunit [Candida albicans P57072]KHC27449.1 electron transfer flavoprotein beta subunit [Candida albicans P76055]KHC27636.1 electron transfer flavoprotein beta subunit [Candida albicans P76067]
MSSKLRILVPVKRVIDFAIKPRINKTGTGIETKGVKFSINPFCDIALEESLRLRENNKDLVENIHAVSIGPLKSQDILRTALAKGADNSTLIETSNDSVNNDVEPLQVAKLIKKIVEKDNSNLVILGKQSIDDDFNQTGQILAGLLNWPQATNASKIEIEIDNDNDNNQVLVTREIDGGEDILKSKLPMIITTDLRLNEPRYASLQNIMKAKKKPLTKLKPQDLGIDKIENKLEILKIEEPPIRQAGVKVDNVDQLIEKLKELKAI